MSFKKKLYRIENLIFVVAFAFILYKMVSAYGLRIGMSVKGKGLFAGIAEQIAKHQYYIMLVSFIVFINSSLILWEILSFFVQVFKNERAAKGADKYKRIYRKVRLHYKSSFLALLVTNLLPKLIVVPVFWIWFSQFKGLQLFTVNLKWYSWIYGYICWEFASWLFHYSSHRVRLLWCFHSPHHGPSEINMTVNWIHFFAESYYATFIHLLILVLLGVNPAMFFTIIAIDGAWGIFTHISEHALADGRLGFLEHLLITPAHHRAHHAKNPLYLDTNFANTLPFWDWVFGTLQPLKHEVKQVYGLLRNLDATNFSDLYAGEFLLLYRDVKQAKGIVNKLSYIIKPPGWGPASADHTAAVLRQKFLQANPGLAITSKVRLINSIKSKLWKVEAGQNANLRNIADLR